MRRSSLPLRWLTAAGVLAALATVPVSASAAVTGSITCSVESDHENYGPAGLFFKPYLNATPRNIGLLAQNYESACDDASVSGAKGPIVAATFKFRARLDDATCSALAGTPQLKNAKITVRWQGTNPAGRLKTIATSKARIASASYDTDTDVFTVVTAPIYNGAFAGQTATLRLGFDSYVESFEAGCSPEGGLLAMSYGDTNPSSLEVE
jgi:hypothetical protein